MTAQCSEKETLFGCLMPHPPLLVPQVGHGREHEAESTDAACRMLASRIAQWKPDTVIVISPHAHLFSDYLFMYDKPVLSGSFARFDAGDVSFSFEQDSDLHGRIRERLSREGIQSGSTEGTRMARYGLDAELDHGVLIPLYYLSLKHIPFKLIALSQSAMDTSRILSSGRILASCAADTGKRVCIIASGDLSHKVNTHSPYGLSPEGARFDEAVCRVFRSGRFSSILEIDSRLVEKSAECGYRSLVMLAGAMPHGRSELLSYESPFGIGYCVGAVVQGSEGDLK